MNSLKFLPAVLLLAMGTSSTASSPFRQGGAPLFRFVQISDTHIGLDSARDTYLNNILDSINALAGPPAFVIVTGDLTENGLAGEFATYKGIFSRLNPAIAQYHVPGNHETTSGTWAGFQSQIGPLYQSFTYANCLFILTNGARNDQTYHGDGYIDDTQLQWIGAQLQGSSARTHVVMANHFPLGTQWGLYSIVDPALSTLRQWVSDYQVTAWLNGHRHFDAFHQDSISHILCGWTGGYGGSAGPGYRLNTVYADRIVSERVKTYGSDPRFVEPAPFVCSNPRSADSDADGLPDSWETAQFGNLGQGPNGDADLDGLTNLREFQLGTNPSRADTDGDGSSDLAEVNAGTDPLDPASRPSGPPPAPDPDRSGESGCGATGLEIGLILAALHARRLARMRRPS